MAARTYELSELLVDVLGVTDVGAFFPHRVTYHPTCHSLRVRGWAQARCSCCGRSAGSSWSSSRAEECCGFGGTFAVKNAGTSEAMLDDKVAAVASTGAGVVSAGDASCLLHIGGGLSRLDVAGPGGSPRAVHLAEILACTRADAGRDRGTGPTAPHEEPVR